MELEAALKRKATNRLEGWGWLVVHIIQSNLNGITDSIAIRNGRHVWIEWKREGGKPRELQLFRQKQLTDCGAEVFNIDNLDSLEQFK